MPSRDEHLWQARHNDALIAHLQQEPDNPYQDWCVTAAFYSAVHLVEAYLATRQRHSADHAERDFVIRYESSLSPIRNSYRRLKNASIVARYGTGWRGQNVGDLLRDLEQIRSHLDIR